MAVIIEATDLQDYIGKTLGEEDWLRIDQERINRFAETTEDRQFIHIDPEAAAKTPFGSTIAHGMLVLSLMTWFYERSGIQLKDTKMAINYGFNKVRFTNPVPVNSEINAQFTLSSATEKKAGHHHLSYKLVVMIKGSSMPALIAEWLVVFIVEPAP